MQAIQLVAIACKQAPANRVNLISQANGNNLHRLGAGLRYPAGANLRINFTYGWQLRDSGLSRAGENSRGHISAQTSF